MKYIVNNQVVLSREPEGPLAAYIDSFAGFVSDQGYALVAVGKPITRLPPHRSVRALLTHTAPTSSIDALQTVRSAKGDDRPLEVSTGCTG